MKTTMSRQGNKDIGIRDCMCHMGTKPAFVGLDSAST